MSGVRISKIFDKDALERKSRFLAKSFQKRYGELVKDCSVEEEILRFDEYREGLRNFVIDAVPVTSDASPDTNVLVGGANALMLGIDHG